MSPQPSTHPGEGGRWTSPAGARYTRIPLDDHPLVSTTWTRHDAGADQTSAFTVARTHSTITAALTGSGRLNVAVRHAGTITQATPTAAMVALDLHPWVGPHVACDITQHLNTERILDTLGRGRLTDAVSLLLHAAAAMPFTPDPSLIATIMTLITPDEQPVTPTTTLSDRTIRRQVRATTDLTPIRLRRTARAATARRLLQTTAHPLAHVAQLARYSDQSHMTNEFKTLCGYTPRQWRQHTTSWSAA